MSEEMIRTVQKLIDSGKGDLNRLHEILNTIKQKAPLLLSDYRYLEELFSQKDRQQSSTEEKSNKKKSKKESKEKNQEEKKGDTQQKPNPEKSSGALAILKNRLALGEITLEEFQSLKKILQES